MSFGRYRNSPLSSNNLADSIMGLLSDQAIPPDVLAAAEHIPFTFHPAQDSEFFTERYWQVPYQEKIVAGKKLVKRFNRWYERAAGPLEKIYCGVAALTESDDGIDTLLDDAKNMMLAKHRLQIIDADDAIYWITDYHAVRDYYNIANALNTERFWWWKENFEAQARRVENIPRWDFDEFMTWNHARRAHELKVRDHFRFNAFSLHGYTPREGRRILVRSMKMMERVFDSKTTREFIQGKPLKIRGHYFEWELQMDRRDLVKHTLNPPWQHVPYTLSLNDLEGNKLAHACVVFRNTPILDQAIATGLSVSNAEDELDLLSRTNIFRVTRAGFANTHLNTLNLPGLTRDELPWEDREDALERRRAEMLARYDESRQEALAEPRLQAQREAEDDEWEYDYSDPFDPAFRGEEADVPTRLTLAIYDDEEPYSLEVNQMVDDLAATIRLPNRTLHEGPFHGRILSLFREVLLDQARTRLKRERDPIASRLREEMYRRLDVRPDMIAYMAKPEFNFHYLDRLQSAPRLESYISYGGRLDGYRVQQD